MVRLVPSCCTVLCAVAIATACAKTLSTLPPDSVARAPEGSVPARFIFDASAVNTDSAAVPACRSPLVDTRNGTRLVLVRSEQGKRADYSVAPENYGVGPADLLRINCQSGAVIGIVPR